MYWHIIYIYIHVSYKGANSSQVRKIQRSKRKYKILTVHNAKHHIPFTENIRHIEMVWMSAAVNNAVHIKVKMIELRQQRRVSNYMINLGIPLGYPAVELHVEKWVRKQRTTKIDFEIVVRLHTPSSLVSELKRNGEAIFCNLFNIRTLGTPIVAMKYSNMCSVANEQQGPNNPPSRLPVACGAVPSDDTLPVLLPVVRGYYLLGTY